MGAASRVDEELDLSSVQAPFRLPQLLFAILLPRYCRFQRKKLVPICWRTSGFTACFLGSSGFAARRPWTGIANAALSRQRCAAVVRPIVFFFEIFKFDYSLQASSSFRSLIAAWQGQMLDLSDHVSVRAGVCRWLPQRRSEYEARFHAHVAYLVMVPHDHFALLVLAFGLPFKS